MTDNGLRRSLSLIYALLGILFIVLAFAFGHSAEDELGAKVFKKRFQITRLHPGWSGHRNPAAGNSAGRVTGKTRKKRKP